MGLADKLKDAVSGHGAQGGSSTGAGQTGAGGAPGGSTGAGGAGGAQGEDYGDKGMCFRPSRCLPCRTK
jgi:hypothetical protein